MAKKKDLIYNIGGDVSGLRAALSRGTLSLGKFAATGTAALAGVGAAMVAVSVKNAAEFEQSLADAASKTSDFEGAMQAFEKAAMDAGLTSAFSANQAAKALGLLAQSGLDVKESTDAVPDVLNLAAAGALGLAEATDIATGAMQGFGLGVEDLARVNDVLAKAANSASTDVTGLGQAMSYSAPVASGLGVSLEETAAVLARLADANIKASRGGTSLNGILANMSKVSKKLGGDLSNADIASLGFAGALDQLQGEGLNAQNALDLFGTEAGPALLALLKVGTGGIREMEQALIDAGGTADLVARQQLNTLSGALTVLSGTTETISIKLGQVFLPVLTLSAKKMQTLAEDALDADGDLSTLDTTLADFADTLSTWSSDVASAAGTLAVFAGVAADTLTVISAVTRGFGSVTVGAAATLTVLGSGEGDASATAQAALDDFDQAVEDLVGVGSGTKAGIEVQNKILAIGKDISDAFADSAEDIREGQKSIADILGDSGSSDSGLAGLQRQMEAALGGTATSVREGTQEIDEELQYLTGIADRWMSQTSTDTEKYQNELWDLSDALERGLIDEETFARAKAQLDEMYDPTGAHEWQKNILALADGAEQVKAELLGIDLGMQEHLASLDAMRDEGLLTWEEYAQAVENASASVQGVSAEMELLQGATELLGDTLIDAIVDPFNTSIEDMVGNFSQALTRMALEAAAQQAIMALFGGASGGGGIISSIGGFAEGGPVSGPGTGTSDSIVARLSDGEYVMPARTVRQYGVGMMERIRSGQMPRFAEGGLVGSGGGGGGGFSLTNVNVIDPALVSEYLSSDAGEKAVLNVISKNARLVKQATGGA